MTTNGRVEDRWRELAPQVLGALVRRYGHFDAGEDAVQEALLAASRQWPTDGAPDDPLAWLITVASRRLTDHLRSESARRRREGATVVLSPRDAWQAPAADVPVPSDDTVTLLFMCCHPALSVPSQLALTLRAVGGLTTAEIARAFFVSEATMAQRISRAKQTVRGAGLPFRLPPPSERATRLRVVLHVLYLVFTEGHTATSGPELQRTDLTAEAIRLCRQLVASLPADGEVRGLLALMLLTNARRDARADATGALLPLDRQDRSRWDRDAIDEGVALITAALADSTLGPYQVQAAIAAVHAEAASAEETDWAQIVALYDVLLCIAPNPMAALNRAVAFGEVHGAAAALALVDELAADPLLTDHHRVDAVRAHLLERLGDRAAAAASFRRAARRTTSLTERQHLDERARTLHP